MSTAALPRKALRRRRCCGAAEVLLRCCGGVGVCVCVLLFWVCVLEGRVWEVVRWGGGGGHLAVLSEDNLRPARSKALEHEVQPDHRDWHGVVLQRTHTRTHDTLSRAAATQDTRHKIQDTEHKTQDDTRHKTQDTRHKMLVLQ